MIKKFIFKSSLFTLPFLLSFGLIYFFGSVDKGDLLRIGFLFDRTSNYRDIFKEDFSRKLNFGSLRDASTNLEYDLLTIGDSFSQTQGNYGYQNYISNNNDLKILNYDYLHSGMNPINTIYRIINGDFLDHVDVKYILLQSVERSFIERLDLLNRKDQINFSDLKKEIAFAEAVVEKPTFTSKASLALLLNLFNGLGINSFLSEVRKVKLDKEMFSTGNQDLLFYADDVKKLEINNQTEKVKLLNEELNKISSLLKEKDVKLIVLPCPDKYGLYYPHFKKKENHPAPLFLNQMTTTEKNYIYIDSNKILGEAIKKNKDVYFWDDTHWSPIASRLIGEEIRTKMIND